MVNLNNLLNCTRAAQQNILDHFATSIPTPSILNSRPAYQGMGITFIFVGSALIAQKVAQIFARGKHNYDDDNYDQPRCRHCMRNHFVDITFSVMGGTVLVASGITFIIYMQPADITAELEQLSANLLLALENCQLDPNLLTTEQLTGLTETATITGLLTETLSTGTGILTNAASSLTSTLTGIASTGTTQTVSGLSSLTGGLSNAASSLTSTLTGLPDTLSGVATTGTTQAVSGLSSLTGGLSSAAASLTSTLTGAASSLTNLLTTGLTTLFR